MFGYGIKGNGWHSVDGIELDQLNKALQEKLEYEDYQKFKITAIERGYTPFYGTIQDDVKDTTVRLYRVPKAEARSDDNSESRKIEYFYCLLLVRKGWTESSSAVGSRPPDESVAHTPSEDPIESDENLGSQEQLLLRALDGTSQPIHEINAEYGLSLFEPTAKELSEQKQEHVLHYLRFFCEFVHGEDGPFYIIDDDEEVEITPQGRKRLQDASRPLSNPPQIALS